MEVEPVDEFELFRTQSLLGGRDVAGSRQQRSGGRLSANTTSSLHHKPSKSRCRTDSNDNDAGANTSFGSSSSSSSSNARLRRQQFKSSSLHNDDSCTNNSACDKRLSVNSDSGCNECNSEVLNDTSVTSADSGDVTQMLTELEVTDCGEQNAIHMSADKQPRNQAVSSLTSGRQGYSCDSANCIVITEDRVRHKRTQSMPMKRRKSRGSQQQPNQRSNRLLEPMEETAGGNEEEEEEGQGHMEVCRVRSFSTKSGEIVNRGDSFKLRNSSAHHNSSTALRQRSLSNDSGVGASSGEQQHAPQAVKRQADRVTDDLLSPVSKHQAPIIPTVFVTSDDVGSPVRDVTFDDEVLYCGDSGRQVITPLCHVVVVGASGVGKTSLRQQLLTSEYLANSDDVNELGGRIARDDLREFIFKLAKLFHNH